MGFWIFMLTMALLIPVTMIVLGGIYAKRAPKKINPYSGYRTAMSMKNQDTWNFAHHYFGKAWRFVGWLLPAPSIAAMLSVLGKDEGAVGNFGLVLILIQVVLLILPIPITEAALRKNFDENGRRK